MVEKENFSVWDLERHETKDTQDSHLNGDLTVIWRDWDKIIAKHPKMVYVNSINPGEMKGPHLHKKRTSYFYCINGDAVIIIQDKNLSLMFDWNNNELNIGNFYYKIEYF